MILRAVAVLLSLLHGRDPDDLCMAFQRAGYDTTLPDVRDAIMWRAML